MKTLLWGFKYFKYFDIEQLMYEAQLTKFESSIIEMQSLDVQENIKISKRNLLNRIFYRVIYLFLCSMSTSTSDYAARFNSPLWFSK